LRYICYSKCSGILERIELKTRLFGKKIRVVPLKPRWENITCINLDIYREDQKMLMLKELRDGGIMGWI
jgi:hypothetical protein